MARENWIGIEHGIARHDRGSVVLSKALRMLLARNDLTHVELARLSAWCAPWGQGWLSLSQISYIRTAKVRSLGKHTLEALMWVNFRLAAAAGNRCQEVVKMLEEYDFGEIPKDFNLPSKPFFLAHPESHNPLDAGGIFMVTLGLLEPEGLGETHISAKEAQELSRCLSRKAQAWILANKLILSDGVAKILDHYVSTEEHKRLLLKNVIFEIQTYTEDQLTEELPAISKLLTLFDNTEVSEDDVVFHLYKTSRQ